MNETDKKLKKELLREISDSRMTVQRKLKIMQLLDQAFRTYMGVIYLSDEELDERDILSRSM